MRNLLVLVAIGLVAVGCKREDPLPQPGSTDFLPSQPNLPADPVADPVLLTEVVLLAQTAQGLVPTQDFSLVETYDIVLRAKWNGPAGTHTTRVALHAPSGSVHSQLDAPLELPESRTAITEMRFPVAGSQIQNFGITGTWTAKVFLDSGLATEAPFRLNR